MIYHTRELGQLFHKRELGHIFHTRELGHIIQAQRSNADPIRPTPLNAI